MKISHALSLAEKRKLRVRGKLHGTAERPRLTVFRSNQYTYLQAIDDDAGQVLAAANELSLSKGTTTAKAGSASGRKAGLTGTKKERAEQVALAIAEQLQKAKITKLTFDRGSYTYHGRLQVVADALRKAGIEV